VSDRPFTPQEAARGWQVDRIEGLEGATVRALQPRPFNSDLPQPPGFVSTSQWISIAVALSGVLVLAISRKLRQPGYRDAVAAHQA
jgi:hypothetical protein